MFFLDPSQGRRRRAIVRDKAYSTARETAEYAEKKGRHWSNKARGLAAETRKMASHAAETVKEKISGGGSEASTQFGSQSGASFGAQASSQPGFSGASKPN